MSDPVGAAKPHCECTHPDAMVEVDFNRLLDTGRFSADIRIRCKDCNEPFRFLGVEPGLSTYRPMCSVDGLELRAPIEPEGTPQMASGARFEIPPLPPRVES